MIKKIPIIDVNTGKVIKSWKKTKSKLVTKGFVEAGDKFKIKQNLFYVEHYGGIMTKEERDSYRYTDSWLYLKKGTIMKAMGSGVFGDVVFEGGEHVTTLDSEWVVKV